MASQGGSSNLNNGNATRRATALVVDDDHTCMVVMALTLKCHGFETCQVESAKEAIDLFGDGREFDFVLMDIHMSDKKEESIIDGGIFSDDGLFDLDDSYEEYCSTQSFGAHYHSESDNGSPSIQYKHCNARMWKKERVNKDVTKGTPMCSMCCKKGDVKLTPTPPPPSYLMELYTDPVKQCFFLKKYNVE
ncbi:hypothetical protein POM88_040154 [Heracleum sosnowskyi]|uniref:Response regulatory domain-containing protein n=1 Tax=Heracleum sosnowskyi TaxID=360622 RepID=A0AAD8MA11_9APIA|nr:hypothetical protein POM88_040154 [Heracleum sosnowskyi]